MRRRAAWTRRRRSIAGGSERLRARCDWCATKLACDNRDEIKNLCDVERNGDADADDAGADEAIEGVDGVVRARCDNLLGGFELGSGGTPLISTAANEFVGVVNNNRDVNHDDDDNYSSSKHNVYNYDDSIGCGCTRIRLQRRL